MANKKDALIQVRIEKDLKEDAENLFEKMGLSCASAIRLFLKQSVIEGALPFKPSVEAGEKN